jgi:ubiquinone/menaquinone biosynthesis C-methylase UbiE
VAGADDAAVARHFEEAAAGYAKYVTPCFAQAHAYVRRHAERVRAERILDVGCGDGALTASLAERGYGTTVGVERSGALLARARERSTAVQWIEADAHMLPCDSGTFDLTICAFALPLFADPARALDELARVTAAEGEILVLVLVAADPDRPDPVAAAERREWSRALYADAQLEVASTSEIATEVPVQEAEALAGILVGEFGHLSSTPESLALELAELTLARHGGALTIAVVVEAHHLRPHVSVRG